MKGRALIVLGSAVFIFWAGALSFAFGHLPLSGQGSTLTAIVFSIGMGAAALVGLFVAKAVPNGEG